MLRRSSDRPIAVTMTTIVLVILGIVSSRLLPISLVPDVDAPYITIQIPAQGISARQLNETVITVALQQLIQLSQLVDLRSEAREGNGIIRLTFEQGSNIDYLFIEVNEKIDRSVSSLPRDLERPKVIKASATDIPAFYINLTLRDEHPATDRDELFPVSEEFSALSRFAAQVITKRIEQLPEVAMVDLQRVLLSELLVLPDETKLRQAGITMNDIEQALKRADVSLGSLTIRDGEYQYNVKFRSAVSGKNDVENQGRSSLPTHRRVCRSPHVDPVVPDRRRRESLAVGRDTVRMGHYLRSQGHGSQRHLGCGSRCGIPRLFPQRRHRSHDTASRRRDGSQHRTETAQPCSAEFRRHPDRPTQRAHLSPARFCDGPLVRGTASTYFRINGLNTITLSIGCEASTNMLRVAENVKEEMQRLQAAFPPGISATLTYDASEYVSGELHKIYLRTLLCVAILMLFVYLVSRDFNYLLIIAVTLAVNILVAVVFYNLLNLDIHIYTLAGITVSLGIIIDSSIIMVDHYSYYRNRRVFVSILGALLPGLSAGAGATAGCSSWP